MREEIVDILNMFRPKISFWKSKTMSPTLTDFYIKPDIPLEKVLIAINNFGSGINPEDVLIYHDTTVMGSGKKGFIITPDLVVGTFGKEVSRADIRKTESIKSKNGELQINGKSLEIMTDKKKAYADAHQLIRSILFILRSEQTFSSTENALQMAEYVWNNTMGIQFAGIFEKSWRCPCGTVNELDKNANDQKCTFCFNTRNHALIYGTPRLVNSGIFNGKITPEEIQSEFPWLLKDKAHEHLSNMAEGVRFDANFGLGCLVVSSMIFIFGIWALFFRPGKLGIPGFVVTGILAAGLLGIKWGWDSYKSGRNKK